MKFLRKLFTSLAALALALACLVWIFDATLFSAKFLTARADEADTWQTLTEFIPSITGEERSPEREVMTAVLTEDYVRLKGTSLLEQYERSLRENGPAPRLDFSDLLTEAQMQGFPIPPALAGQYAEPTKFAPLKFGPRLIQLKIWLPVLAMILGAFAIIVTRFEKRFTRVARVFISSAVMLGIFAGVIFLIPYLVANLLGSGQYASLSPLIGRLARSIAAEICRTIGLAAVSLLVLAGMMWVAQAISKVAGRREKKPKAPSRNPLSKNRKANL